MSASPILLEVKDLRKRYQVRTQWFAHRDLWALNNVDLQLPRGSSLGVVGESGCGKTTLARCIMHLETPTDGEIQYENVEVSSLSDDAFQPYRRRMQMVFQDPTESLNPRKPVGKAVEEALLLHTSLSASERRQRVRELFGQVRLRSEHLDRFPHQLSSGQRQRVGIARALAVEPELLVLDEPTSALDVSVRGRILQLLIELRAELGLTYLVISHDLSAISKLCDHVMVMYLGMVMEEGKVDRILRNPVHPYTLALLTSIPRLGDNGWTREVVLQGEIPSALEIPPGCPLVSRCPFVLPDCSVERPPLGEDRVACIRAEEIEATGRGDLDALLTESEARQVISFRQPFVRQEVDRVGS